ncbi:dCTP deaminase domain-containing protein [Sharpea azabuensis]|uniref:dCTP deaminase domain-containing protein n=1 Tax=Sharpea azabuensis TaxID=322505 RepID=UPI0015666B0A|nr:hypothetical protein [Sharpea azabuensis]
MYLAGNDLNSFVKENVDGYREGSIGIVSYDLIINEIYDPNEKATYERYQLNPGDTVFVGSNETVSFPDDCLGFVNLRNSAVRMGIGFYSPVYHPGHRTRIFTRIKNESSDIIMIERGQSVLSLMIYQLDHHVEPYSGKYTDQFDFANVHKFESTKLPDVVRLEKAAKKIEDSEQSIYGNVMTIMTIFIAIFSIVNLNMGLFGKNMSLKNIMIYNDVILTGISLLVTLISVMLGKHSKMSTSMLCRITIVLFVVAILMYFLM